MVKKHALSWTFLGLMLFPSAVYAENTGDAAPKFEGSTAGSLIWVIVALLIVVGLIVLFIKFLATRNRNWGVNRAMRSLGGVTLGPGKSLQVVEAGGRIYVVGVGDEVNLLDKITDPDAAAAVVDMMEAQASRTWNPAGITELWNKVRNRGGKTDPDSDGWNESSFEAMLNDKLKRRANTKSQMESMLGDSNNRDRLEDE